MRCIDDLYRRYFIELDDVLCMFKLLYFCLYHDYYFLLWSNILLVIWFRSFPIVKFVWRFGIKFIANHNPIIQMWFNLVKKLWQRYRSQQRHREKKKKSHVVWWKAPHELFLKNEFPFKDDQATKLKKYISSHKNLRDRCFTITIFLKNSFEMLISI